MKPARRPLRTSRAPIGWAMSLASVSMSLAACGSDASAPEEEQSDDPVEQVLTDLGVDTAATPRLGDELEPLPEDYSPFGSSRSFDTIEELALLGVGLGPASGFDSRLTLLEIDRAGTTVNYSTDVLFAPDVADTPWAESRGTDPTAVRAAARGDVDGDGLEELFVVYQAAGQNSVTLQRYDDQASAFASASPLDVASGAVTDLALAAADLDGDGAADLALGLVSESGAELRILASRDGVLEEIGAPVTLERSVPGSSLELLLEAGNLDYDPANELVAVANERYLREGSEAGTSRYVLFDDAQRGLAQAAEGLIRADLATINRTAVLADLSIGDIDGDNVDEVVFAGLTHLDPDGTCGYDILVVALDDLVREHAEIGATEFQPQIHGGCGATPGRLRATHVDLLDLDGDGVGELQVNGRLFEDFLHFPAWTPVLDADNAVAEIPQEVLFASDGDGFVGSFTRANSAMAVGDLTADSRQDIVFYSQSTGKLQIWGLSDPDPDQQIVGGTFRMLHEIAVEASPDAARPILLPLNVNADSLAVSFDTGEHELVFTEPVLVAALAAAPCYADLGQNLDACRTAYGTAESTTVDAADTLTVTAGVTVGFESEFSVLGVKSAGLEVLATVKAHASLVRSRAYTLTKTVVYTTGPIEDTVILTTVPLDQYTYTIKTHPDPELVGSRIVVSMPRAPIELQVERAYFNEHALDGGPRIDSSVFAHAAGAPNSYPSSVAKDSLLARYTGLEIGPASVGQGGGDENLEINVATESGLGVAYGVEFELAVQATAGVVVAGFSVGFAAESSLTILHGQEATYTGSVAALPSRSYAGNAYDWGMFTYVLDDHPSGQQFEVINYWVD